MDLRVSWVPTQFGESIVLRALDLANETPIIRFVNLVLFQGIQDRASDKTH